MLQVVEYAEKNTNRSAGRKLSVDEKRVREWKKQKRLDIEGGGRKAAFPDMEEELAAWMREWS